ncbi:nitroreductase/quinone reductase family protein [Kribbella sp. VKM Ac-2568]|uniref:nitroreductase/quinone reductase family protein n=1 Tax=Kribbella sp. VKM Ac-2568 TaxID=2512219 RepID=UPI00104F648B|nr:nitroreductase/quinone reductase family protein [Kribbella sp. VKM Ac-2568]TCM47864.1 deazaflavin-dependent oxidoreductase (nitroreductase family) [Kribbella sp. VKM Ac-2568]
MNRGMARIGNHIGVWMYRTLNGRLASTKNAHVLLLTVRGRRTGLPRSACVRYLATTDGFLVWGTASGAPHDPDWFRNLRSTATAEVQIDARHLQVRARELTGKERDAAWTDVILAAAPTVARYAAKAKRTIPVALLTPLQD